MIAILTVLITLAWNWYNIKKDKNTSDIFLFSELSKKFPNKYLVEKLFFDIYKCRKTNFEEIKILSEHPTPLEAVKKFTTSRYFGKAFELKRHKNGVSVEFTDKFNSKKKRIFILSISLTLMLISYLSILFFTAETTKSIILLIQAGNVKIDNMLVELLKSPAPITFALLTIVSTMISMYSVAYSIYIVRVKKTIMYFKSSYTKISEENTER